METNTCNVNHLDVNSHLPPRKRLLAGLKRQNPDVNSPAPSTPYSAGSDNDLHLNNILMSQLSNPNLSNEEIAEASRTAAMRAANVAAAARANADEKAAKAAKAVTAAKIALDLVAILSDEAAADKERFMKKNKMKKHVTVEALYSNKKRSTNCRADEELARNLHRAINSSPRILKNSPGSDGKNHKHKRLKTNITSGVQVGEGDRQSTPKSNGNDVVGDIATESPKKKVDLNASKHDNGDELKLDSGEGSRLMKLKLDDGEILDSFGKKRGRLKQKKLPLSICSFKDQTNLKDELRAQQLEGNSAKNGADNQPLFPIATSSNGLVPVERTTMWKCQSFKAPACVEQNKVMQS